MPFLGRLQSVDSHQPYFPYKEPSFQALLTLQHQPRELEAQIHRALELQCCEAQQILEFHSPVKSEAKDFHQTHPIYADGVEVVSSDCNQDQADQPNSAQNEAQQTQHLKSPQPTRERKKRKRTRPTKNKEEVENQRMTHIAVERNRRRQMNDHLNVLRSLMPPSYIRRGDQASIVGGAIDFVKELEQLHQSLEVQKRIRKAENQGSNNNVGVTSSSPSSSCASMAMPSNGIFMSLSQCRIGWQDNEDEVTTQNKSEVADIEVTVIQTHVNLKIQCQRSHGQLMKVILALEDLRLTVLHLSITSSQENVIYSFNLKIEEECNLGSADEIARTVHQIFSFINGNSNGNGNGTS